MLVDPPRALRRAALYSLLGAVAACRPSPPSVTPTATPAPALVAGTWGSWRTLRAEHHVTVEAHVSESGGERVDKRSLRGAIAVERPGRLRLRALGPGGITLFDILIADGKAEVIEAVRDPSSGTFSRLLASISGDLAAAFDLAPRPDSRRVSVEGNTVLVEEAGRTARLADFHRVGGGLAPSRIVIDSRPAGGAPYHVEIEATHTTLDEPLDPALFTR